MHKIKSPSVNQALFMCVFAFFLAQFIYTYWHMGFFSNFYGPLTQLGTAPANLPFFKQNFWQSLWYFHISPPLYILYSYGFVILFPPNGELGFYVLHTLLGVWAVTSLYKVQIKLNIASFIALAITIGFVFSPAFNLYQSMGWYDFPNACLLIIATWRLCCFIENSNYKNGFIFFAVIAFLCSIRSLYHICFYFIPLIFVMILIFKGNRKKILLTAFLPFMLVFSMYLKNYILFDTFTINSFSAEVLANITMQWNFPLKYRIEGINKGYFNDLALCPQSADTIPTKTDDFAYTGYYCYKVIAQKYRDAYIEKFGTKYVNIPVLQPQNDDMPQRNTLGNIGMDKAYQKNAINALMHHPEIYLRNVVQSYFYYFDDSVSYFYENMTNHRHLPVINYFPSYMPNPYVMVFYQFSLLFAFYYLLFTKELRQSVFAGAFVLQAACILYAALIHVRISEILFFISMGFLLVIAAVYLNPQSSRRTTAGGTVKVFFENNVIAALLTSCVTLIFTIFFIKFHTFQHVFRFLIAQTYLSILLFVFAIASFRYWKTSSLDQVQRLSIIFILCNIVYTSAVVTLTAGNEQQRYRFYIDPLYMVLLGLFLSECVLPIFVGLKSKLENREVCNA